jgi:DNA processing protein
MGVPPPAELKLSGARLPARLADLPEPPEALYLRGELPCGPAVAVVGTRHPTESALAFARGLGGALSRAGVSLLSGGAIGIDTAAHLGALDVGGATMVVAPASFDRPYPPDNAALFQQVVDAGGAYLTAEPPGTVAKLHRFWPRWPTR